MSMTIISDVCFTGRQFDKDGNLYNWWTTEAENKFKERAQCLIEQYSSFVSPEAEANVCD